MESLNYWRLCDAVSVVQAALLVVGDDPSKSQSYIDRWAPEKRPKGYDAARTAIINAIGSKRLPAIIVTVSNEDAWAPVTDWHETTVEVDDLRDWLRSRGIKDGFFFPEPDLFGPDYLIPAHNHYAPKLAAAVGAWEAISSDPALLDGKTVKQAIIIWLRQHANDFGLTKGDGNPNEQGIEEVAKIANWDSKGGAPKTPGS